MKALLDTNFLMIPGKFKVDILSGLMDLGYMEIFTLDMVVAELEKLSAAGKGKESRSARIGLELIRRTGIAVLKTEGGKADEEILRLAKKGYVVCTQDRELIRRITEAGMVYITLRQGKYLAESRK